MNTVTFWDVDGCLYPNAWGLHAEIGNNMRLFMMEQLGFREDSVLSLETEYYQKYGNTLRGLRANGHQVDLKTWYNAVHKPLAYRDFFKPDLVLRELLLNLPGRHIIFTNGDQEHANTLLSLLGIRDCFEKDMIDIFRMNPEEAQSTDLICKPDPRAFECAMAHAGITADAADIYFYDDSRSNTKMGKAMGWTTVQIGTTQLASALDADACFETIQIAIEQKSINIYVNRRYRLYFLDPRLEMPTALDM